MFSFILLYEHISEVRTKNLRKAELVASYRANKSTDESPDGTVLGSLSPLDESSPPTDHQIGLWVDFVHFGPSKEDYGATTFIYGQTGLVTDDPLDVKPDLRLLAFVKEEEVVTTGNTSSSSTTFGRFHAKFVIAIVGLFFGTYLCAFQLFVFHIFTPESTKVHLHCTGRP